MCHARGQCCGRSLRGTSARCHRRWLLQARQSMGRAMRGSSPGVFQAGGQQAAEDDDGRARRRARAGRRMQMAVVLMAVVLMADGRCGLGAVACSCGCRRGRRGEGQIGGLGSERIRGRRCWLGGWNDPRRRALQMGMGTGGFDRGRGARSKRQRLCNCWTCLSQAQDTLSHAPRQRRERPRSQRSPMAALGPAAVGFPRRPFGPRVAAHVFSFWSSGGGGGAVARRGSVSGGWLLSLLTNSFPNEGPNVHTEPTSGPAGGNRGDRFLLLFLLLFPSVSSPQALDKTNC
jgi:hypothetical protein